jgi:hypothetical protein
MNCSFPTPMERVKPPKAAASPLFLQLVRLVRKVYAEERDQQRQSTEDDCNYVAVIEPTPTARPL